ncbi:MAG: N-acetylmuramidase domain-containing protein, partial [Pseudomonadota bacterium]
MLDHISLVHSDFRGAAKRLEDIDITLMGRRIGVGEDEIHAFMEVEAAGSGFDREGRPKMLFEPHVFYRNLRDHEREEAVKQGVAYRGWRKGAYPKDSYPRLKRAMLINEAAALNSCSWGLGQVLGENHAMVGFSTPVEMVIAMMDDEDNHLEAMIEFIIAADIDDDLRAHRWENVARVYNGPGYKTHGYHTRLAAAFRRWSAIPDTVFTEEELATANDALTKPIRLSDPAPVNEIKPADSILQMGARGPFVRLAQTRLKAHGYHLGAVDGQFGSATRGAVLKFQADNRLITDGVIGRL